MAIIFEGMSKLMVPMEHLATLPNGVKREALKRAGEVVARAQRQKLRSKIDEYAPMPYRNGKPRAAIRTGQLAASIKPGKIKMTQNEASIEIKPTGSRTRGGTTYDNAEIAHYVEFGARGIPARPFVREANEECDEMAVDAAASAYFEWLDTIGF